MSSCRYCGRRIREPQTVCPWCKTWLKETGAIQERLPGEATWDSNYHEPSEVECDMCGKPGATLRSDNGYYCGKCWQVWRH